MKKPKHTPTPWIFSANAFGENKILSRSLDLIMSDNAHLPSCPSPDDMRHIVKCVNLHDELLMALMTVRMSAGWFYMSKETKDIIEDVVSKAAAS